jgi:hypothetical protein
MFIDFLHSHPFIKASFVTLSWIKQLSWDDMHFTHHTKVNDEMEFRSMAWHIDMDKKCCCAIFQHDVDFTW